MALGGTLHPRFATLPGGTITGCPPTVMGAGGKSSPCAMSSPAGRRRTVSTGCFGAAQVADQHAARPGDQKTARRPDRDRRPRPPDGTPEAIYVEGAPGFTLYCAIWTRNGMRRIDPVSRPLFWRLGDCGPGLCPPAARELFADRPLNCLGPGPGLKPGPPAAGPGAARLSRRSWRRGVRAPVGIRIGPAIIGQGRWRCPFVVTCCGAGPGRERRLRERTQRGRASGRRWHQIQVRGRRSKVGTGRIPKTTKRWAMGPHEGSAPGIHRPRAVRGARRPHGDRPGARLGGSGPVIASRGAGRSHPAQGGGIFSGSQS